VDASRSSLVLKNVSVRYPQRGARRASELPAVSDISFSVAAGEFVAIVGPSGCGKSTLLKAIAGLVPLASGTIAFGGGQETRVGFVFQTDALLPWSTASGNIELALRLAGASAATAQARARALLTHVGLEHAAEMFPGQLSGGMRKRVAIARALAYDPAVFLMDESFSALDAQTRIHVGNFFLSLLVESQQTVVFVTHDIEEAVALADRVLVMSRGPGRIECEITVPLSRPRDYHATRFVAGFDDLQRRVWTALPTVREMEQ
jgi:NitT/TauT family transport system ATP-binding protein